MRAATGTVVVVVDQRRRPGADRTVDAQVAGQPAGADLGHPGEGGVTRQLAPVGDDVARRRRARPRDAGSGRPAARGAARRGRAPRRPPARPRPGRATRAAWRRSASVVSRSSRPRHAWCASWVSSPSGR